MTNSLRSHIKNDPVHAIFYYGTGVIHYDAMHAIRSQLLQVFPEAKVTIKSDLAGAVKVTCGNAF